MTYFGEEFRSSAWDVVNSLFRARSNLDFLLARHAISPPPKESLRGERRDCATSQKKVCEEASSNYLKEGLGNVLVSA